jgi:hypothetical protein
MFARLIAASLVLVLVGPSVVAATCELTCAMGRHHAMARHHHSGSASTTAPCHDHQGAEQGAGVRANPIAICHESGDLPWALVDASLNTVLAVAVPAPGFLIEPPIIKASLARAHESRTIFEPPSTHRPLRV